MKHCNYLYYILLLLSFSCRSQGQNYTDKEKKFISLFTSFSNYVKNNPIDSTAVKHIILNYIFSGSKAGELNPEQSVALEKQLKTFRTFLKDKNPEDISSMPVRLAEDKTVPAAMSIFQKENCLIYFDKHDAGKIFGYILFMPPVKGVVTEPRIWSWILTYQFGKYMFRSVTGEEGYEYIFTPK